MQLSELTRVFAPASGQSADTLRVKTQRLYQVPELAKLGMGGRRAGHSDSGLTATATTAGLLALTALLPVKLDAVGAQVLRLWRARYVENDVGRICPVTEAGTLGDAIERILARPELAGHLDFIELGRESEIVGLAWADRPYQPSLFHPKGARGYRRIIASYATTPRVDQIAHLPGTAMRLVAGLIDQEKAGAAPKVAS